MHSVIEQILEYYEQRARELGTPNENLAGSPRCTSAGTPSRGVRDRSGSCSFTGI
jgi:hypothetical protein